MVLVAADQSFYTIDVPPDPEPTTAQEKVMAKLQMKEVDIQQSNLSIGVVGVLFIVIVILSILAIDLPKLKQEFRRLKKNLRIGRRTLSKSRHFHVIE